MGLLDEIEFEENKKDGSANYVKFKEEGDYKLRILSKPIHGWEKWSGEKEVRFFRNCTQEQIEKLKSTDGKFGKFWAFIVWNYNEELIQIWKITQSSIKKVLKELDTDEDYGPLHNYDIKITREGKGLNTTYSVKPLNSKSISDHIKLAFYEKRCNLDAYFSNENPFAKYSNYTSAVFDDDTKDEHFTSPMEALQESLSIEGVNADHLGNYLEFIAKSKNITQEEAARFGATLPASSFKDAYKKYVSKNFAQEVLQPA